MPIQHSRRQTLITALSMLTASVAACRPDSRNAEHSTTQSADKRTDFAYFDVAIFNYLNRPIFDVRLNKKHIGLASTFNSGHGLMTGVKVPLGPQMVSWRLDGPEGTKGNGDTVHAANTLVLVAPPEEHRYLGVHIYPDNTVEIIAEAFWPEPTERGSEIRRQLKMQNKNH